MTLPSTLNTPLVSIYIPTHNRAHLIERAVLSVINQTYPRVEVIIVDDGSTDRTPEVLDSLVKTHSNITVLRHGKARGACASRNLAIDNANGEFVTGLDDDDEFLPHRVEDFVQNYDPSYSLLCSTLIVSGREGITKTVSNKSIISWDDIKAKNFVGGHIFVERKRLTEEMRYAEEMPAWQDYDLSFRLIRIYGSALKLNNHSYKVDLLGASNRITDSANAAEGFKMFIRRHGYELTPAQINNQRINDLYNRRVKLSVIESIGNMNSLYSMKKLSLLYMLVQWPKVYTGLVTIFSGLNKSYVALKNKLEELNVKN